MAVKKTRRVPRPRECKIDVDNPLTLPTPWVGISEKDLEEYAGFVYLITNTKTKRKYIGRKNLWASSRVKVAGRKNRKRVTRGTDWKHYKGSCEELKDDIRLYGLDSFTFEVIHMCKTRRDTNYKELEEQVKRDVLHKRMRNGEYEYYNGLISAKVYREKEKKQ